MRWLLVIAVVLFACKMTGPKTGLVEQSAEKAYVFLIKIPPGDHNDELFDGGSFTIEKPKKGLTLLQFESSGTLNWVRILSSNTGSFENLKECNIEREVHFQVSGNSTMDVTILKGTFLIRYSSCNIAGEYILTLK